MIHSGTGVMQMENYMSTIEVESLSRKAMSRRQGEVRSAVRTVAESSCAAALDEETTAAK